MTALLRVPGGAEVSGFGIRERLIGDRAHGSCPAARTGDFYGKKTPGGAGTDTHGTQASKPPL